MCAPADLHSVEVQTTWCWSASHCPPQLLRRDSAALTQLWCWAEKVGTVMLWTDREQSSVAPLSLHCPGLLLWWWSACQTGNSAAQMWMGHLLHSILLSLPLFWTPCSPVVGGHLSNIFLFSKPTHSDPPSEETHAVYSTEHVLTCYHIGSLAVLLLGVIAFLITLSLSTITLYLIPSPDSSIRNFYIIAMHTGIYI